MPKKEEEKQESRRVSVKLPSVGMVGYPKGEFDFVIVADEVLDGKYGFQFHAGARELSTGRVFNVYYKLGQDEKTGEIYVGGQLKGVYAALSEHFGDEVSGFGEGELIGKAGRGEFQTALRNDPGHVGEPYSKPSFIVLARLSDLDEDIEEAAA